jgi:hypothetical protein
VTRKQNSAKGKITADDLKRLLAEDRDLLKTIIEETLQQVLEAEMDEGHCHSEQMGFWVGASQSVPRLSISGGDHLSMRMAVL